MMETKIIYRCPNCGSRNLYEEITIEARRKLNDGWVVVMCNKISDELEYILEKEVSNNERQ